MNWIKFSDRKPDFDGPIFVYAESADPLHPYFASAWWSLPNDRVEGMLKYWCDAVTHWMKPERPTP
jgi:hypothetical protein